MSDISKSAIGESFPPEFEAAVAACESAGEVAALMRAAYVQMGAAVPDEADPNVIYLTDPPNAEPRPFISTVEVDGKKYQFTGDTAESAQSQMIAFVAAKAQAPAAATAEQPLELVWSPREKCYKDSKGRYVAQDVAQAILDKNEAESRQGYADAARDAELRQKLLRGEISLVDALAEVAPRVEGQRLQQSWAAATQEFLASDASVGWPGGEEMVTRIGTKIDEMGLVDAADKVSAISQAFAALQAEDAEKADSEAMAGYQADLAKCVSQADVNAVNARWFGRATKHGMSADEQASTMFG